MAEYINKEDALDVFESIIHSLNENRFKQPSGLLTELYGKIHGVGLCRDIIKHAPSADVAPVRHGRWDADMGGVWCSVCGEYSEEGEWDYCPYCGAKMDGGEDDA